MKNARGAFDSVEVYIDATNGKSKLYTTHDFQFLFPVGAEQAQEMRRHITTGVAYHVANTDTGYTMAIALPFQLLGIAPFQGDMYGLEVHLTHNDSPNFNTRRKKAWWGTDDTAWTTPSVFGVGRLMLPAGQPGVTLPAPGGDKTLGGNSQVTLSWTAVPGADGYKVKRAAQPGGPYTVVAGNLSDTSFTEMGLDSDGVYY